MSHKRLHILSDLEQFAFYGFPDFNEEQRSHYMTFDAQEWQLISVLPDFHHQVYCALQIAYFKAKKLFFRFKWDQVPKDDLDFVVAQYFDTDKRPEGPMTKHEYYLQRQEICRLFGYRLWSNHFLSSLKNRAEIISKRDISPYFIANDLLKHLQDQKIVKPRYSTLQDIVSHALSQERKRLKNIIHKSLSDLDKADLDRLIEKEETLPSLAALRKDLQNFTFSMMAQERQKHQTLKPLYETAKGVMPSLEISDQSITHYASLAHYYTLYDLKRFEEEQRYLYLLCYCFKRYQQINNNLIDAFIFHVKKLETEVLEQSTIYIEKQREKMDDQIGRLLLIYVDDTLSNRLTLGSARKKAFHIMPKDSIRSLGEKMLNKPQRQQLFQWQLRDKMFCRYSRSLRPLFMIINFQSQKSDNPLLEALEWVKNIFKKKKPLSSFPFEEFPRRFISRRLSSYLIIEDASKKQSIQSKRYELLLYRQLVKQLQTGSIYVEESLQYRPFSEELVSLNQKEKVIESLNIPWLKEDSDAFLKPLLEELEILWNTFNQKLQKGELQYITYDSQKEEAIWSKPKKPPDPQKDKDSNLYRTIPINSMSDVLRFVAEKTGFLSAFSPLQPRYIKRKIDEDNLIAVLTAQATGIGHYEMSQTSDISYAKLEETYQQYMRLATLEKAHDIIANDLMTLSIFPHYAIEMDLIYGSVDGQKYEAMTPTAKARYSRKYYKKGRGIVAYTLLAHHIPLKTQIIGPHEHESYFLFDIWYNNTSLIQPTVLTGDMHSVNKANFALLHWFGVDLRPRLTNLKREIKAVMGGSNASYYKDFLIKPAGKIDQQVIVEEKENIDRIIATLALKETNQRLLIQKLCSLSSSHKTRKAVFEFNKIISSIYTLKCLLDPNILFDVHRSQNRIESYHTLRASIAKIGGKKALIGRTDLEMEISNLCGRLMAGSIIYYNASLHSHIFDKDPDNKKLLQFLKKNSPVAWDHLCFTGFFSFYDKKKPIDLDDIIGKIDFEKYK